MILTAHSIICDGCGLTGTTDQPTMAHAVEAIRADGWTRTATEQHYCRACTEARKEI